MSRKSDSRFGRRTTGLVDELDRIRKGFVDTAERHSRVSLSRVFDLDQPGAAITGTQFDFLTKVGDSSSISSVPFVFA